MKLIRIPVPGIILWSCFLLISYSCRQNHEDMLRQFDKMKTEGVEEYALVYAYTTYLSTNSFLTAAEAEPLVLELISLGRYTEARYCIDNLENMDISSWDLVALRGLCYFNEKQSGLALPEIERALSQDPENLKIQALLDRIKSGDSHQIPVEELLTRARGFLGQKQFLEAQGILDRVLERNELEHRAIYLKGLIQLQQARYDSALYYFSFAQSISQEAAYTRLIQGIEQVLEAEKQLSAQANSFTPYLQKARALASLQLFAQAHDILTQGLEKNPENVNLLLAKALVWVQAGQRETAEAYLQGLEQQGLVLDPGVKEQILQTQSQTDSP